MTIARIETFTPEQLAKAAELAPSEWALVSKHPELDDWFEWAQATIAKPAITAAAPTSTRRLLETMRPEFDWGTGLNGNSLAPNCLTHSDAAPRPTQDDVVWP